MPSQGCAAGEQVTAGVLDVGIDIVLTQRIAGLLRTGGEDLLARMLGPAELAECRRRGEIDLLSVAGRVAAKEAAFKALGSRGEVLPWLDLEVRREPGGRPVLTLHAAALRLAERAGVSAVRISISHDGEYAVAVATAVGRTEVLVSPAESPKEHLHG